MIRSFQARERTIVITTHYLDEAERLCNRVAVIDAGKVIALGTPKELISSTGGENVIAFTVESGTIDREALAHLPGVTAVRGHEGSVSLAAADPYKTMQSLLDWLRSANLPIAGLTTRHATLEDVFVNLTGRHLRDDGDKS